MSMKDCTCLEENQGRNIEDEDITLRGDCLKHGSSNKDIEQIVNSSREFMSTGNAPIQPIPPSYQSYRGVLTGGSSKRMTDQIKKLLANARTEAKREVWDDIFSRMSDGELEITISGKVAERMAPSLVKLFPELKENQ